MKPDPFIIDPITRDYYLSPLNAAYHKAGPSWALELQRDGSPQTSFREQMAVLYLAERSETHVTLLRSFLTVGEPGAASLDPDNPGQDTPEAWEEMNYHVEHGGAGTFHTHPPGVYHFSGQDEISQNGLAKSEGSKLLWHGVQTGPSAHTDWTPGSYFVCCQMLDHKVFRFHYGFVKDDLKNPVIVLPLPPVIGTNGTAYHLDMPGILHILDVGLVDTIDVLEEEDDVLEEEDTYFG